jgi:hypothetical protein
MAEKLSNEDVLKSVKSSKVVWHVLIITVSLNPSLTKKDKLKYTGKQH